MSDNIKHDGIIEHIEGQSVRVRIVQQTACSQCVAARHCGASEHKVKSVDVRGVSRDLQVGDRVVVVASAGMGVRAVVLAFAVPLAILIVALAVVLRLTHNESVAALGGIASLIPYYIILYGQRHRLRDTFTFRIE